MAFNSKDTCVPILDISCSINCHCDMTFEILTGYCQSKDGMRAYFIDDF